jgi:4-amino-4-deoxy-L-arabinose transferase-like glycosyltransferase
MAQLSELFTLNKLTTPLLCGVLLILACLVFLPGLGSYGMLDPTDSFFVEAPREMLSQHHYLTPLFNYVDWFDKPAFPFLLIVASYKVFGISAWAARLPSALSGIAIILCTALTASRIAGVRAGLFSALVLMTCPLFLIVGHSALTDEPLALFVTISMLGFAQVLILEDSKFLLPAYVALSLAILCKGPIGLVIVVGSLVSYSALIYWHQRQRHSSISSANSLSLPPGTGSTGISDGFLEMRAGKPALPVVGEMHHAPKMHFWVGTAVILVLACPYYLIAHATTSGAFTREFFLHQNIGRFEGTVNHQQPMWFYLPIFLAGYFPWTIIFLAALPQLKQLWQVHVWTRRQRLLVLSLLWLVFVFVLFSFIPTKLPTYIVPLSSAFALITGIYLDLFARVKSTKVFGAFALGSLVLSLAAIILAPKLVKEVPGMPPLVTAIAGSGAAFSLAQIWCLRKGKFKQSLKTLFLSTYLIVAFSIPFGFYGYYITHQRPIDALVLLAKSKRVNLATLFNSVPSAIFVFNHRIPMLQSMPAVKEFSRSEGSPHWLLATRNCLAIGELHAREHIIANKGKWYLISVDHLSK